MIQRWHQLKKRVQDYSYLDFPILVEKMVQIMEIEVAEDSYLSEGDALALKDEDRASNNEDADLASTHKRKRLKT